MIFTSLDETPGDGPTVKTAWGHEISLDSAQQEVQRLQDRIDAYERELNKQHDSSTRKRLRAKLERYEREHDALWGALNPVWNDETGYSSAQFDPGSLIPCRSASCSHQITRHVSFQTGGWCPPCFRIATNPKGRI